MLALRWLHSWWLGCFFLPLPQLWSIYPLLLTASVKIRMLKPILVDKLESLEKRRWLRPKEDDCDRRTEEHLKEKPLAGLCCRILLKKTSYSAGVMRCVGGLLFCNFCPPCPVETLKKQAAALLKDHNENLKQLASAYPWQCSAISSSTFCILKQINVSFSFQYISSGARKTTQQSRVLACNFCLVSCTRSVDDSFCKFFNSFSYFDRSRSRFAFHNTSNEN